MTRDSSGEENFGILFFSKVFELNAATGSVTIANPTGGLGGEIDIDADNIHVADDAILMKLFSVDDRKLRALGYEPTHGFDEGLAETVAWYRDNEAWWRPLKSIAAL